MLAADTVEWTIPRRVDFFLSDRNILNPVGFKLQGDPHFRSAVGLGVWEIPGVWEAIQDSNVVGYFPCLRNRLLTKSVNSALGVLGVSDKMLIDLKGLDARDR